MVKVAKTRVAFVCQHCGFSWKFNNYLTALLGYEVYNNPNFKDTATLQLDIDF